MKLDKKRIEYHALRELQFGPPMSVYEAFCIGLTKWMAEEKIELVAEPQRGRHSMKPDDQS